MVQHVIVVDREEDFKWPGPNRQVLTAKDFVKEPGKKYPTSARVINLCRDYSYLSLGYYSSLLAEARGQKVIPSVEVLLDLNWKRLYQNELPELNDLLRKTFSGADSDPVGFTIHLFFGASDDVRLREVARRVFDLFRAPLLAVDLRNGKEGWEVISIRPISINDLPAGQEDAFALSLDRYTRTAWRAAKPDVPAVYSIAILHNPQERQPPSNERALKKFIRIGEQMGVEMELITRKDYSRLPEFDALFIRETTDLDDHTYRFARKAEDEGMPVIDSPQAILKCTNKIYLAELLNANGVPTPKTLTLDRRQLDRVDSEFGYPVVIKIPDGSFSRGVHKVQSREELNELADKLFEESDLILAQEFMQTEYDWRVGVLDRKPIYVCQYFMAKGHWQVLKYHGAAIDGANYDEGDDKSFSVENAPREVIDVATKAASLIGDGLHGVDLKQTPNGVYVIEINDNPNIDAGVEDAVLKDDLYRLIVRDFIRRIEKRTATLPAAARPVAFPSAAPLEDTAAAATPQSDRAAS
ncbi:MAG TPA: RimK family protein [Alphaproteobacteria bacterium]|jgi:glutathione synthase/RimK-type ligase-like ATP-grasp enzyme